MNDRCEKFIERLQRKNRIIEEYENIEEGIKKIKKIEPNLKHGYLGAFSLSTKKRKSINQTKVKLEYTQRN